MPTLDDVYRKFGETAEAAQLLETELGNLLLEHDCIEVGSPREPRPGQGDRNLRPHQQEDSRTVDAFPRVGRQFRCESLEQILSDALAARNRLTHSFYMQHNLRRNSRRWPRGHAPRSGHASQQPA